MILLTDANFNGIQLCFLIFFNWRCPKSTICKKPHLQVFWQKNRFFQFVNFGVLQFKKLWKQSWMALELASVSSMISEILIKIGLKMTIFIYEFFGISLDAFTVSLYNRAYMYIFVIYIIIALEWIIVILIVSVLTEKTIYNFSFLRIFEIRWNLKFNLFCFFGEDWGRANSGIYIDDFLSQKIIHTKNPEYFIYISCFI